MAKHFEELLDPPVAVAQQTKRPIEPMTEGLSDSDEHGVVLLHVSVSSRGRPVVAPAQCRQWTRRGNLWQM
jgi:hypothetical protein